MILRICLCALTIVALTGCGRPEKPKSTKPNTELEKRISALPSDPLAGEKELERRFSEDVKIRDGLIIVRDAALGGLQMEIFPATTPWSVKCGIGFNVVFGPKASAEDAGFPLVMGLVDKKLCDQVAPIFAHHLKALLAQGDPATQPGQAIPPPRLPGEKPGEYLKRVQ